MAVTPYPISEAVSMLLEGLVPNFSWFFNGDKEEAAKFRKALTTELGRRSTLPSENRPTTSLITTVHKDKVVYVVILIYDNLETDEVSNE